MNNTSIIIGPPGTGKTTTLLDLVDEYLSKGTDPMKIGFVSFTRKSVEEAKARAAKRFNKNPKFFHFFRTLHSLAFYQLAMTKNDVMELDHYREVGKILGVVIKGKSASDYAVEELEKGDQLVFIESLARMRCESIEDTYNRENLDFSIDELYLYKETLEKYKKVNILSDFTDMLTKFLYQGVTPALDVLFVDEAQDTCLLQWKLIEKLSLTSAKTYIAGDDDQAIFRWSGADIEYFIDLTKKHPTTVLKQSYRLPSSIHNLADTIISEIRNRVPKKYKATKEKGQIEWVASLDDIDMSTGNWLILVRNIFMINQILEYLRYTGFTYSSRFKNSKDIESLEAALNWERLRKGESIKFEDAKVVLSFMSNKQYTKPLTISRKSDSLITLKEIHNLCQLKNADKFWYDALDKISVEDREYFIAARRRGEAFVKEPRIHVSTIHGAKGGECEML
jgi:DNA helicase-2/ATP-dependent DNA helicase PcrA